MVPSIPLFGPLPVGPELLIILLVLVLLFGANKIPKLARSTGQAMGEFKKGREEIEEELNEMQGDADETTTDRSTDTDASADETSTETSSNATDEEDSTETETESSSK
ncbi:sec-independent protein translocase protein TatA [Halopenitus malekzadehii]|uniref:Sec-independent protein translocase protein TatA n=1 Tax=Halopenitus malekzadehii TaxID=1267564 RepID=A0A1H6J954_9EURY|nr:twin-arginine translocase TatA/TatE family subunit [Halopenitus malekzadehii]SEH55313.1 sec-independent protein translocase protein TatA [Halopenitus malekzadehii]